MKKTVMKLFMVLGISLIGISAIPSKNISAEMIAGENLLITSVDLYVHVDELSTFTQKDFLQRAEVVSYYSLTGTEAYYYEESVTDPAYTDKIVSNTTFNANDWQNFKNGGVGHYTLNVSYYNDAVKQTGLNDGIFNIDLHVSVVDDHTSYNPDMGTTAAVAFRGSNFEYSLAAANGFNTQSILDNAEAYIKAWDSAVVEYDDPTTGESLLPGRDLKSLIHFNDDQIQQVSSATKSGAYALDASITYLYGNVQGHSMFVFLTNANSIIDRTMDVALFADDFTISLSEVQQLSEADVKTMGNVSAYVYSTGADVSANANVDITALQAVSEATVVELPVTYNDGVNNLTSKVKVTVVDENNTTNNNDNTTTVDFVAASKAQGKNSVNTGDTTNMNMYGALLALSAMVILGAKYKSIKKN